jgi:hypothetical protein
VNAAIPITPTIVDIGLEILFAGVLIKSQVMHGSAMWDKVPGKRSVLNLPDQAG